MDKNKLVKNLIRLVVLIVVMVLVVILSSKFFYLLKKVDADEVGVRFRGGAIYEIVGPGLYSDAAILAELKTVKVVGLPFSSTDAEVITNDRQRLGLEVTGTVHRPGLEKAEFLMANWSDYKTFYIDDVALVGSMSKDGQLLQEGLMQRLSKQAMKVCIGDRTFDQSVIGSSRDDLRSCIESELTGLVENFGLEVKNVVVPNIVISPEVQAQLDAITLARLSVEKAKQETLQVIEEANKQVALEQGVIRVQAGEKQEQARQDAITAELQKKALEAQKLVIEAQKANDLLTAQKDLEIQTAVNLAAQEAAKAKTAEELALALMYENNPIYVKFLTAKYYSEGFKVTDKIFFLQQGLDPTLIFGNSALPTFDIK
jgi:hypothetical protein